MTNQMLDMEFVKRLERLESENRKLKRIGTVILAVGCILFLSAQTAPKNQTVEAEKFVLRDAGGKVRGRLSADSKKTLLELFNAEGQPPSASLCAAPNGAGAEVFVPAKGEVHLSLGETSDCVGPEGERSVNELLKKYSPKKP